MKSRVVEKDNGQGEGAIKPKECYRCKHKNAPDAKYCEKCNFVLSPEGFEELQKQQEIDKDKLAYDIMARILYIFTYPKEQNNAEVKNGLLSLNSDATWNLIDKLSKMTPEERLEFHKKAMSSKDANSL